MPVPASAAKQCWAAAGGGSAPCGATPNISNINFMEPSNPNSSGSGGPSQGGPSQGAPSQTQAETEQEMLDSYGGDTFHVPPVADYIPPTNRVGNLADQLSNTNLGESSSSKSGPSNK